MALRQVVEAPKAAPIRENLDRVLVHSIAWIAASRWLAQLVRWGSTLLTAKLLLPADYGIVGMAMVVIGLVNQVAEFGLGAAVVQHRNLSRDVERRLAGTAILISGLLALATALAAPAVAAFYGQDALRLVLPVVSVRFLIDAAATVPRGILARELQFKSVALIEATESTVMAVVALTLAYLTHSYWALILSNLAGGVVFVTLINLRAPVPPRPPGRISELRPLLRFGRDLVLSRLSWYAYSNADFVTVGKMLSRDAAGAYAMAMNLASVPGEKFASLILSVAPGIFSTAKSQPGEVRRLYLGMLQGVALVTVPLGIGMSLVADNLVWAVLGAKWIAVINPLRVLALVLVVRAVSALDPVVLLSRHETHIDRNMTALFAILLPVGFVIGSRWGTTGVALAWLCVLPVVSLPLQARFVWRKIEVSWRDWTRALWPAASSAAAMTLPVLTLGMAHIVPNRLLLLVLQATSGGLVYVACLWFGHRSAVTSAIRLVRQRGGPPGLAEQASIPRPAETT